MVQELLCDDRRVEPEFGPALRCLNAIAVGLAAGLLLAGIDAAGYFASLGFDEWPQILSFSTVLSTAIYVPVSLAVTVALSFVPRLRSRGHLEALLLTILLGLGLLFTNLNRALTFLVVFLNTGQVNLDVLKKASPAHQGPLLWVIAILIMYASGRFVLWPLRRVWASRGFWRFTYGLAGLAITGLVASVACLCRTTYSLDSSSLPAVSVQPPAKPHVVILVLDTARVDAFSCYGGPPGATPHLDRLADEGTLFEDVLSPGIWTEPSHASMFTGLAVGEHGVGWGNHWLEDRFVTLAEHLQAQGYYTLAISCNRALNTETNMFQGFDEARRSDRWFYKYNYLAGMNMVETVSRKRLQQWFPGSWAAYLTDRGGHAANQMAQKAIAGAARTGDPMLLFINYIDAHWPYVPPRPYREALSDSDFNVSYRADFNDDIGSIWSYMIEGLDRISESDMRLMKRLHQGAVSYLDSRVNEIVSMLDHYGLTDHTLLIVTSDHGDNIGEHGLMSHHFCVYDTLARVPLIVRFPGRLKSGRIKTPVQTTDIFPTVLAAAGIDVPANPDVARNLLHLEDYDSPRARVVEYNEAMFGGVLPYEARRAPGGYRRFLRRFRAIKLEGYKFIWSSDGDHELYYIPEDPGELHNLIKSEPSRAEMLGKRLDRWLQGINKYQPPPKPGHGSDLPDETRERLRNLGYL